MDAPLNIYFFFLTRKGSKGLAPLDTVREAVVIAVDEAQARQLLGAKAMDEGAPTWLKSKLSTCEPLGTARRGEKPRVVTLAAAGF